MTCGSWMADQLIKAVERDDGQVNESLLSITKALHVMPRRMGAADAKATMAAWYYRSHQAHYGEVACLETLHYAPTFINPDLHFDCLVNLVSFCATLKSFEEAWEYGLIAEKIKSDDTDLMTNMISIAALSGREAEASKRFERLVEEAPMKAQTAKTNLTGELPGTYHSTRNEDCSDILQKLQSVLAVPGLGPEFPNILIALQQRPEGKGAKDCWTALYRYYKSLLDDALVEDDTYIIVQASAGIVATTGKALNAADSVADGPADDHNQLWEWRGRAFARLRLFELAIPALENAQSAAPGNDQIRAILDECRSMSSLRQQSRANPECLNDAAREKARSRGEFWSTFDLFQEYLYAVELPVEKRIERSVALYRRGFDLFESDKDEAARLLCEAAAYNPDAAHVWKELGSLFESLDRYREAEQLVKYSVALAVSDDLSEQEKGRFYAYFAFLLRNRALHDTELSNEERESKLRLATETAKTAAATGDSRAAEALGRWQGVRPARPRAPTSQIFFWIILFLLLYLFLSHKRGNEGKETTPSTKPAPVQSDSEK